LIINAPQQANDVIQTEVVVGKIMNTVMNTLTSRIGVFASVSWLFCPAAFAQNPLKTLPNDILLRIVAQSENLKNTRVVDKQLSSLSVKQGILELLPHSDVRIPKTHAREFLQKFCKMESFKIEGEEYKYTKKNSLGHEINRFKDDEVDLIVHNLLVSGGISKNSPKNSDSQSLGEMLLLDTIRSNPNESYRLAIVKRLLADGVDANAPTHPEQTTPLFKAVAKGDLLLVQALVEGGADVNLRRVAEDDASPLYLAAQENHFEIVRYLLEKKADLEFRVRDRFTPLYVAAEKGNFHIVEFLLEMGANINSQCENGSTPQYVAAQEGHAEVVRLLAQRGADLNLTFKGFSSLYVAARNGHRDALRVLIEFGLDVNFRARDGATPLYVASQSGHLSVVKELLRSDLYPQADPEISFSGGYSPLYVACQNGYDEVVETLLAQETVNVNRVAPNGVTPLYIATQIGYTQIVEMLLRSGANPNLGAYRPLHIAAFKGHLRIVELLLANQADVNALNLELQTALHFVAKSKETFATKSDDTIEIVRALLQAGALKDAKDLFQKTPLDYANENGVTQVAELIAQWHSGEQ
jgi:ankyrin repeat protein